MGEHFNVQCLSWNRRIRELLIGISATAVILLIPLYLFIYPVKNYPGEIQTAYYLLVVPEWVSDFFITGICGIPMYLISVKIFFRKIDGYLIFYTDKISFVSKRPSLDVEIKTIESIFFVPRNNLFTKEETYRLAVNKKDKTRLHFRLKNETDPERLLQVLISLEDKIKLKVEPDDMISVYDEDE